ncbi:tetratricopeptide repeat protein [bacterium]|nr:tetratricopeptide repeat protein [bacterium]
MKQWTNSVNVNTGSSFNICISVSKLLFSSILSVLKMIYLCIVMFSVFNTVPGYAQVRRSNLHVALQSAATLEREGNLEGAIDVYQSLYKDHADNSTVFSRYKELCYKLGRLDEVEGILSDYYKLKPNDPFISVMDGRLLWARGDEAGAKQRWEVGFDKYPTLRDMVRRVANVYLLHRRFDAAEDLYLRRRPFCDRPDAFSMNLASIYAARFRYGDAVTELLLYLQYHPAQLRLIESRILGFKLSGEYFEQVVSALKAETETHAGIQRILANVLLKGGVQEESVKTLLKAAENLPAEQAKIILYEFARRAMDLAHTGAAKTVFTHLSLSYKNYRGAEILLGLARSAVAEERFDEAEKHYMQLISQFPKTAMASEAAYKRAIILRDQLEKPALALMAFNTIQQMFTQSPQIINVELESGKCYVAMGKMALADSLFCMSIKKAGELRSAQWLHANVEHARIQFYLCAYDSAEAILKSLTTEKLRDDAVQHAVLNDGLDLRRFLRRHRHTDEESKKIWSAAALYERLGRRERSLLYYDSLTAHPDLGSEALAAGARMCIEMKDWEGVCSRISLVLKDSRAINNRDTLLWMRAEALERLGNNNKALVDYELLLSEYPYSLFVEQARTRLRILLGEDL